MSDLFEMKLASGLYKTAYDPIAKRYVEIKRVREHNGKYIVLAQRAQDTRIHRYSVTELTDYCL